MTLAPGTRLGPGEMIESYRKRPTFERWTEECLRLYAAHGTFPREGAERRLLAAVNYAPTRGQCYVRLPWEDLRGRAAVLADLVNPTTRYERDGGDLARQGLYLDVPAWGHHVFEVTLPG